jgi:ethanolamine utilization protein EutQ (cupin superfamily)
MKNNVSNMKNIDMKDVKVSLDVYSEPGTIHKEVYITSNEEIKLGDGYLKLYDGVDISEVCFCDDLRWVEEEDLKVVSTNDDYLIKKGVTKIDDDVLEWIIKSDLVKNLIENVRKMGY